MQASRSSTAARVFLVVTAGVVLVTALLAVLLVLDARRAAESGATDVTRAVATGLAADPRTVAALQEDPSRASRLLQPVATRAERTSGAAFVTIMTPDGIRVTHPDPAQVGRHYIGTIPDPPRALTERTTGTLGPSVRTIVPVRDGDRLVGWVATGVTVDRIGAQVGERLPFAIAVAVVVFLLGVGSAFLARRTTRRVLGDLPPGAVRDAVASVESVRTLGEALRSQQHEYANRVHTAVTLIELDRSDEAVALLTEGARDAQHLVDHVRGGDPTVAALLLGKASQAGERHIGWQAEIEPDVPSPDVRPVDLVAVVGNLVDNALDAAADGPAPRWVRVAVRGAGTDRSGGAGQVPRDGRPAAAGRTQGAGRVLEIEVADSGAGIAPAHRSRVFERGWSTKSVGDDDDGSPQHAGTTGTLTTAAPAASADSPPQSSLPAPVASSGRGIGLALVRSVVDQAGGTVTVHHDPTRFVVRLPTEDTP